MFAMSEDIDTIVGLRFAGIEGIVVGKEDDPAAILRKAAEDPENGIILMTVGVMDRCSELVQEIKEKSGTPLISIVPDRRGKGQIADTISRYVSEAVGIKL